MITASVLDSYLKNYKIEILDSKVNDTKHYDFYKSYSVKSKINGLFFDIDLFLNFETDGIYTHYEIKKIYNEYGLIDTTLYYLPKSGFLDSDKELSKFFNNPLFLFTSSNILDTLQELQKSLDGFKTVYKINIDDAKFSITYTNDKLLELEFIYNSNVIFFSINSTKFSVKNKKHYTDKLNLKNDVLKILTILNKIENNEDINLKYLPTTLNEIVDTFNKKANSSKLIINDMNENSQYLEILSEIFLSKSGVVNFSVVIDKPYRVSGYVDYILKIVKINEQDRHVFDTLEDCLEFINDYKLQNKL